MSIGKRTAPKDIDTFIAEGNEAVAVDDTHEETPAQEPVVEEPKVAELPAKQKRTGVSVYLSADMLKELDRRCERRGMTRSAWVQFVISHAIEQGEL